MRKTLSGPDSSVSGSGLLPSLPFLICLRSCHMVGETGQGPSLRFYGRTRSPHSLFPAPPTCTVSSRPGTPSPSSGIPTLVGLSPRVDRVLRVDGCVDSQLSTQYRYGVLGPVGRRVAHVGSAHRVGGSSTVGRGREGDG